MRRRHIEILRYVRGHVEATGLYPTQREICAGIGTKSTGNVQQWMTDLVRSGHMRRLTDRATRRSGRSQAAHKGWQTRRNPHLKDNRA